jgi:glutathione reductase (NADPH)
MTKEFDLVVIGAGVAGNAIAFQCSNAGMSVAMVESRQYGGTCPLRGCNPKKVLVSAAEVIGRSVDLQYKGLRGKSEIDWPELMRSKRSYIEGVPERVEKWLDDSGVETFHGSARFVGKNTIQADGEIITGKYIAVCTGALPVRLGFPGEEYVITSDQFLELDQLPPSITFIGGGYISFEFAHVAARAGSKITIIQRGAKPLKKFDQDLVGMLVRISEETGIDVRTDLPVTSVEKTGEMFLVRAGKNNEHALKCDLVVHGGGRVPDIENLALDKAGVETSKKGVVVNEYMQSVSNPYVYAAGDSTTSLPLTPTASLEADAVIHNIINGNSLKVDHTGIPSVVFTSPPLAAVGMGEEEAKTRGIDYELKFEDTSGSFSSSIIGLKHSGIKVLIDKKSNTFLGAHILGHHAEEVINIFAMAIRLNLTVDHIKKVIWAYPCAVYDIKHLFEETPKK